MGKNNQHQPDSMQFTQNQNNQMSDDPKDGSRDSFTLGKDGNAENEKAPPHDAQDKQTIDAYGRSGSGSPAQD